MNQNRTFSARRSATRARSPFTPNRQGYAPNVREGPLGRVHPPQQTSPRGIPRRSLILASALGAHRLWRSALQAATSGSVRQAQKVPPPAIPGTLRHTSLLSAADPGRAWWRRRTWASWSSTGCCWTTDGTWSRTRAGPTTVSFARILKFYTRYGGSRRLVGGRRVRRLAGHGPSIGPGAL
jgi:hypothetical protein